MSYYKQTYKQTHDSVLKTNVFIEIKNKNRLGLSNSSRSPSSQSGEDLPNTKDWPLNTNSRSPWGIYCYAKGKTNWLGSSIFLLMVDPTNPCDSRSRFRRVDAPVRFIRLRSVFSISRISKSEARQLVKTKEELRIEDPVKLE